MQIVGDVGHGRMGPLKKEQAFEWLKAKDTRRYANNGNDALSKNMNSCISNIEAASGSTASGGGNTRYTFMGAPTYHVSNGAGQAQGVTLFFVKRPGNVAKIVAIGYHVGAQTYDLTWVHHDWSRLRKVGRVTLD